MNIFKRNPFGHNLFIKKWLIRILGVLSHTRFNKFNKLKIEGSDILRSIPKNNVLFVGLGKTFQIWEPKYFEKFKIVARKKAYQNRSNLKWENKQKGEII